VAQKKSNTNEEVKVRLWELYNEVFSHDGYGEIRVELRFLKKGQKEVIIHCGKQYQAVPIRR
jgi:phage-related protein